MDDTSTGRFNFDHWRQLAERDPACFEAQRRRVLDAAIRAAPQGRQQRLRRLQWRVDQTRRLSGTPMAACLRISGMMWDSVCGPQGLLRAMNALAHRWDGKPRPLPEYRTARVIRFPGPRTGPGRLL